MQNRGVYKIIAVSTLGLILSGCTIGPLTLPDLPNPFAQKSQSGPAIDETATPTIAAEFTGEAIDVATDQPTRTINLDSAQKITFINTGKSDVSLTLTLDRDIPVTVVAGGKFVFNFTQSRLDVRWGNTTLTFINAESVPAFISTPQAP